MNSQQDEEASLINVLLQENLIISVERTPGTNRVGNWIIITQAKDREAAEVLVDSKIKMFLGKRPELATHESDPRRIQSTTLPFKYITALVKDNTSQKWNETQDSDTTSKTNSVSSNLSSGTKIYTRAC